MSDRSLPGIRAGSAGDPSKPSKVRIIAGIAVAGLMLAGFVSCVSSLSGSSSSDSSSNRYEAIAQCEARIEEQLRSPATAEFNTSAHGALENWTVSGTVDSANGFGALVRSDFECTVQVHDNGTATTSIDMLEQR